MFLTMEPQLTWLFMLWTLLKAWLQVVAGTYVALGGAGAQFPKKGTKWKSRRAPVTPRMMNTISVSIPRKPRGLMNLDGKTIFNPKSSVLSSLSQVHLRRAMRGSRTPFFSLGGSANSYRSVYCCCPNIPRGVRGQLDLWERI